jgi:arginine exporter protein ArgO
MIGQSKEPLWKRALMRAALVAVALFASIEVLRLFGRSAHIDRAEAFVIAGGGAAVYSALWFVTAAWTARMLKKIEDAAKDPKK